jgi:hypothetical protein
VGRTVGISRTKGVASTGGPREVRSSETASDTPDLARSHQPLCCWNRLGTSCAMKCSPPPTAGSASGIATSIRCRFVLASSDCQSLSARQGCVQDRLVAACDLGLVKGGIGCEQGVVVGVGARVEERATDADGGINPAGPDGM